MVPSMGIEDVTEQVRRFRDARNWKQFHNPKDLAEAISIEAAELLEVFLWQSPEDSRTLAPERREDAIEEIADVFIYLLLMCDALNVDLLEAALNKIRLNGRKYPIDKSRDNSAKYSEY